MQRVLSIQSFVVHGYVGNKCSMFALQSMGFDVDPICTVQLSNHTGYPKWRGQVLGGDMIRELFTGLTESGLADGYSMLLTGYCRDPTALKEISAIVDHLRAKNPSLLYLCDPVMGDESKLYVPLDIANIYRDELVRKADIVKLNGTELQFIASGSLDPSRLLHKRQDAFAAMDELHAMGPRMVVVTSFTEEEDANTLFILGSTAGKKKFSISVKRRPLYYSGTGDLFAALLLGWLFRGLELHEACERVVSTLQTVLDRTGEAKELALVPCRNCIEAPPTLFKATFFSSQVNTKKQQYSSSTRATATITRADASPRSTSEHQSTSQPPIAAQA